MHFHDAVMVNLLISMMLHVQDPERNTEQNILRRNYNMLSDFTLEWGEEVRMLSSSV